MTITGLTEDDINLESSVDTLDLHVIDVQGNSDEKDGPNTNIVTPEQPCASEPLETIVTDTNGDNAFKSNVEDALETVMSETCT